jgi:hypothetical protein
MKKIILAPLLLFFSFIQSFACTIISGTDAKGQTWVCNNEDESFSFNNYINVFPRTDGARFGYITVSYGSPGGMIQGGVNEAGLFFDYNTLPNQEYKLKSGRKPYPGGREAMLQYVLQHCKTVPEVLKLWDTYYRPGMDKSQWHLADALGNFAVITPDSIIVQKQDYQVSTNFNLRDPDPVKYKCWRYPIAQNILRENGITKENLLKAAFATYRKANNVSTIYTNMHNLNTGEMWLYFGEDSTEYWHANIHALLKKGRQSFKMSSLFPNNQAVKLYNFINKGAGAKQLYNFLENNNFTDLEKESMLRHCYQAYLIMENQIAKADLVYQQWLRYISLNSNNDLKYQQLIAARHAAYLGNYEKAEAILTTLDETSRGVKQLKSSLALRGKENMVPVVLKGYPAARSVYIHIADDFSIYFMQKEADGWIGYIPKNVGAETLYVFYVDDKRLLDAKNSHIKKGEAMSGKIEDFSVKSFSIH